MTRISTQPGGQQRAEVLGTNLRAWRLAAGHPLKRVSAELGVAASTWSQWETGRRFPLPPMLEALADFFNCPVCRLFSTTCAVHEMRVTRMQGGKVTGLQGYNVTAGQSGKAVGQWVADTG